MRFLIMHKSNAHWESGAIPGPALIARVGTMLGELQKAGVLLAGEGLRASAEGVRLRFAAGARTIIAGPFRGDNELPAGFSIVRVRSLDEAVEWATRQAQILGDGEIDIRPVTEPWDIGMRPRPANVTTRRFMILRKATAESENGEPQTATQQAALSRLIGDATAAGVHLATETLRPSARGRRYKNSANGVTFFDGPFIESKELTGGYIIVSATSREDAYRWAEQYIDVVDADEVDVRELE